MKAVVVGGGIIGLTAAHELRRRGLEVVLLERGTVGSGASGAAGGILSPLHPWECSVPTLDLLRLSEQCWPPLFEALRAVDRPVAPISSGLLYLDADDIAAARRWADEQGLPARHLDGAALRGAVPGLAADEGFLLVQVQQLASRALLKGLAHLLASEGVAVREHHRVDELLVRKRQVCGVVVGDGVRGGEVIEADCVVLCAGAWTARLCPDLPPDCVRPMRGQMIALESASAALPHIIVSGGRYLIPRPNGRIIVGSTVEDRGFDDAVTDDARRELLDFAAACLPALRNAAVKSHWAGLRPAPSATEPLMGRHPTLSGLFISAGHFRNGIALASGSARLLGELVTGGERAAYADHFAV